MSWVILVPAILGFLAAVLAFLQSRRNTGKIEEVHILVNGRVAQLKQALENAGIAVPDNPIPDPPKSA
jgi:hypothetical protein